MQTSYFAKYRGAKGVSIAKFSPTSFKGRTYRKLAPPYWLLNHYKKTNDKEYYIEHYYEEILNNLNAQEVYEELGEDVVLLCYERSDNFCHRHLVAEWFEKELGIKIEERKYESK